MDKLTAEKYHDKIFRDNQDMAKNARVVALGLDQYYKYACASSEYSLNQKPKKVLFRLVPDPAEISNAIQLTTESNRKEFTTNFGFEGVPVYQVESLYVKLASGTMRATPLFLSKESAEISLSYTCETKKKHIDPNLKELVNKTKTDIDKAKYAFESLRKPDVLQTQQKSALPRKFNQHEESEELSRRQSKRFTTSNSTNSETIIEVGSLEWVIQQMEQDCVGIWSEIIFIPPGIVNLEKKHG
jgi:hypothetical protein